METKKNIIKKLTKKFNLKGERIWWYTKYTAREKELLTENLHKEYSEEIWNEAQKKLLEELFKKNIEDDTLDFKGFYMLCYNKRKEIEEI